jgi:cytochrome b
MKQKIKIWDLPTRLFHWSLVSLFGFMWFSGEQGGDWLLWHTRAGVLMATLLIFRIIWGLIGSDTAKFSHFLKGRKAVMAYIKEEANLRPHDKLSPIQESGHNPLGGWMVFFMVAVLCFQVITGLLSSDTDAGLYDGFLAGRFDWSWLEGVETLHEISFSLLLLMVAVHVSAIIFYAIVKKTRLIPPMVKGYISVDKEDISLYKPVRFVPNMIALVAFLVAAGLMYVLLTFR